MKNIKPLIRKAVLSDRAGLFPLLKDFSTSFSPEETAFDIAFENILSEDSAILLVALLDNCLIGYCLGFDHYAFYANGRVSWVEELMVHEAFRKKNIGRALMTQFEAWAKSRKSRLIGLATRRASPFYQALDYKNSAVFFRKLL
jgi:GNAT superfamily N-acetyltransferase